MIRPLSDPARGLRLVSFAVAATVLSLGAHVVACGTLGNGPWAARGAAVLLTVTLPTHGELLLQVVAGSRRAPSRDWGRRSCPALAGLPALAQTRKELRMPMRLPALSGAVLVVLLSGCGDGSPAVPADTSQPVTSAAVAPAATGVTIRDAWAMAASDGMSGMSAVFGTIENPTDHEVTVVSATSPQAATVRLHEAGSANGATAMRPATGGFVVPAHGTHTLALGGDHLMLMGVKGTIKVGDRIAVTLTLKDGTTVAVTAPAKEVAGVN